MRIPRPDHLELVRGRLRRFPVVALVGARQVGKTTLAREIARGFRGTSTFFDLERAADLVAPGRPRAGPAAAARPRRTGRGAAPAGSLPDPSGARRPPAPPRPLPGTGQRVSRAAASGLGEPGGTHLLPRVARPVAGRGGRPEARPPVAPRRLPALLHRAHRERERRMAAGVRPHVPGARPAPARHARSRPDPGTLLGHAGTRPRQRLERVGVRPRLRRRAHHRAAVPGPAERGLRRSPAAAVEREPGEAAGEVAQGVRGRLRAASHPARHRKGGRAGAPSQGGRVLGGVRHPGGHRPARSAPATSATSGAPTPGPSSTCWSSEVRCASGSR